MGEIVQALATFLLTYGLMCVVACILFAMIFVCVNAIAIVIGTVIKLSRR